MKKKPHHLLPKTYYVSNFDGNHYLYKTTSFVYAEVCADIRLGDMFFVVRFEFDQEWVRSFQERFRSFSWYRVICGEMIGYLCLSIDEHDWVSKVEPPEP